MLTSKTRIVLCWVWELRAYGVVQRSLKTIGKHNTIYFGASGFHKRSLAPMTS